MAKNIEKLSPLTVKNLKEPGYYGDGANLWLQISSTGSKSWLFRFTLDGKAHEMGMGAYPDVTLKDAREQALAARALLRDGTDPLALRKAGKAARKLARAVAMTFDQCADAYIEAHRAGWKNAKHADQWVNTIRTYASPLIGAVNVNLIDTATLMKILEPIWTTKTETASRLRGRIESVLGWATVRGYRSGDNPARWKGHLDNLLPAPSKVSKVEHHAALPFPEIGSFMVDLRKQGGMGALALEFAILTACRSGEVRGASWSEIDQDAAVWTIPASRMKAEKEHRVPLSEPVLQLLRAIHRIGGTDLVFPNTKGASLSDMTLTSTLRRMGRGDITGHGFRSTFRDWAGETTGYPREVIEHALAHQLKDKAEASYARGSLFTKRGKLMADWARYCGTVATAANVSPINSVRKEA